MLLTCLPPAAKWENWKTETLYSEVCLPQDNYSCFAIVFLYENDKALPTQMFSFYKTILFIYKQRLVCYVDQLAVTNSLLTQPIVWPQLNRYGTQSGSSGSLTVWRRTLKIASRFWCSIYMRMPCFQFLLHVPFGQFHSKSGEQKSIY